MEPAGKDVGHVLVAVLDEGTLVIGHAGPALGNDGVLGVVHTVPDVVHRVFDIPLCQGAWKKPTKNERFSLHQSG